MTFPAVLWAAAFILPPSLLLAQEIAPGAANAAILVIRHAEKPVEGDGLTPAGEARARAYVDYFKRFNLDGSPVRLDAIFAAADSKNSRRPRLTVEPLAHALNLSVRTDYRDKDYAELADDLRAHWAGKTVLVCWHHGKIDELLQRLGARPQTLLPGGVWPEKEYDSLIELRYDASGQLRASRCLREGLTGSR